MVEQVLVADVGGTNTRVALAQGARVDMASVMRFANAEHASLDAVLESYLKARGTPRIAAAAAAVAGPVENGRGRLTNLDWDMDGDRLRAVTGASRAVVMNDLVAQGHALGHLDAKAMRPILPGTAQAGAVQLVIGIGTGFNAAPVHDAATGRLVAASECGHITLPTLTAADRALADDIAARHDGFPGVEEVLSGRGILGLYHRAGGDPAARSADFAKALAAGQAPAVQAADTFARILGMVVGDLALVHLPFGGIHLIGGVARAVAPRLADPATGAAFRDGFRHKGRFSDFMQRFAVNLIEDDFAALTGMAAHLRQF
ncbi:glucokinase [Paracoccus zhouxuedongae]|uniref:glucokinase n=1 Tax=unclassified Paracoccus (in: a-proteobacteria) TaxID=2688777 RepID=UPI0035B721F2